MAAATYFMQRISMSIYKIFVHSAFFPFFFITHILEFITLFVNDFLFYFYIISEVLPYEI